MRSIEERAFYRLRPSVSLVPKSGRIVQFFISDTRYYFDIEFFNEKFFKILTTLDGEENLEEIFSRVDLSCDEENEFKALLSILVEKSVVEQRGDLPLGINEDPFRRVIHFLASCLPSYLVQERFKKLQETRAVICGVGGVGSWIFQLLAQTGVKRFILIDDDVIKLHNLNRSLFTREQIGKSKIEGLRESAEALYSDYFEVVGITEKMKSFEQIQKHLSPLLETGERDDLVFINSADYPSVDTNAKIMQEIAFHYDAPLLIAGGYNMHLSLLGPTIIPRKSPCFYCIEKGMDEKHPSDLNRYERLVRQHRNLGNLAPLASITASFVVDEFIKVCMGSEEYPPVMQGKRGEFNYTTRKINLHSFSKREDCSFCGGR